MIFIIQSLGYASLLFALTISAVPFHRGWEHVPDIGWEPASIPTAVYPAQQTLVFLPMVTTTAVEASSTASAVQDVTFSLHRHHNDDYHHNHHYAQTSSQMPVQNAQSIPTASLVVPANGEPIWASPSSPAATSSISSGDNGSCSKDSPCTGDITYYDTATTMSNPSACGTTNDGETEMVLALPQGIMTDSDCGKTVTVTYDGTTKIGTVVDKCMGCDNSSIDLSRALFEALAGSLYAGRISGVEWYIN